MANPDIWTCTYRNNTISKRKTRSLAKTGSRRIRLHSLAFHILTAFPLFWGIETLLAEHGFSNHDNILTQYPGHFFAIIAICSASISWSALCLLLHGYMPVTILRFGSLIQDVAMSFLLAVFAMSAVYGSSSVQSFKAVDYIVLGAAIFAWLFHFGRLVSFAAQRGLPQLPYVDEGEYDLIQAFLYLFSICSATTSFSLKIISQEISLEMGSVPSTSTLLISSNLLRTLADIVIFWNLCNAICVSFVSPVLTNKMITSRLPLIASVCAWIDIASCVIMVALSTLCYTSLSPLGITLSGSLTWAETINECRVILAMVVAFFAASCQGLLAIGRISAYSFEEERADSMRELSESGWLNYLYNFPQTDDDLVAFLKIPALTEIVRDRIVSKIYNLPREDSSPYWRWNSIKKDLEIDGREISQTDPKISVKEFSFWHRRTT